MCGEDGSGGHGEGRRGAAEFKDVVSTPAAAAGENTRMAWKNSEPLILWRTLVSVGETFDFFNGGMNKEWPPYLPPPLLYFCRSSYAHAGKNECKKVRGHGGRGGTFNSRCRIQQRDSSAAYTALLFVSTEHKGASSRLLDIDCYQSDQFQALRYRLRKPHLPPFTALGFQRERLQ